MKYIKIALRIFSITALLFFGLIIFTIAAFVDWPTVIKIKMYGKCPSETIEGNRHIDFLDYTLVLPDKLITSCFAYTTPDLGGFDPASIDIDAKLPDFTPLQDVKWPDIYKSDDQIRVSISGYEVTEEEKDAYDLPPSKLLTKHLSRTNRDDKPVYSKTSQLVYGLEHYTSDKSIPIYSDDTYVAIGESGEVEFYLRCFDDKEKHHKYWNCTSSDIMLKPGVSYRYYYNSQYLPNAHKIHNQIQQMVSIKE